MSLFFISFIAGILTILAPCVLPLLPVIVGGSLLSGKLSKRKVVVVISSLGVSILLFTFLLKVSTVFIDVPEYFWQWLSGIIVIVIGIVTIFPKLWANEMVAKLNRESSTFLAQGEKRGGFLGNIVTGVALGPVFSTCSPTYFIVLATVLPVSLFVGTIYMIAYIVGLCLSLVVVVFISQKILNKIGIFANPNGLFKKFLGILFVVVGVCIILGFDKKIQLSILNQGFFDVTRIEQRLLEIHNKTKINATPEVKKELKIEAISEGVQEKPKMNQNISPVSKPKVIDTRGLQLAADISTPDGFINTDGKNITISEFKGKKVVLVSFWTFSCINCKRTLPYLNEWYAKYKDQGLEIVSIHTPEFAFERVQKNVEDAVIAQNIKYPVVLDNDYSTWNSYGNQFWPRKYLVNKDGYIVYDHIGEGGYEETETEIKKALEELNLH